MPKTDIDYSNTIIYKITCKDPSIKDVYVGHTTNFIQRKHAHKQNCLTSKTANYKCKLYEVIRANGGWDNWYMEMINAYNCKDHYEARKKEQEYFISLNATLNSIEPLLRPKVIEPTNNVVIEIKEKQLFFCESCNIYCNSNKSFEEHNMTRKHVKNVSNINQLMEKSTKKHHVYSCETCQFICVRKPDWLRHLTTAKHTKLISVNNVLIENTPKHKCSACDKEYKSHVGLWKHKKTCAIEENITISNQSLDTSSSEMKVLSNLIMEMVKSNSELQKQNCDLQKQVLDVCKNSNTSTINSHNNNNNKTFNLQFFLNEQCKDAMNISDFANSINLQLSDFESVGELGYVEGITKIMLDRLNSMDIYKRPIHCSDAKREIIYVKDHDKWEKEEKNNPKLRYAIKTVSFNNMKLMGLWSSTYPESMDGDSRLNDKYMKLIKQSTGGNGEIGDSENKIIRRIAKEILIDKNL